MVKGKICGTMYEDDGKMTVKLKDGTEVIVLAKVEDEDCKSSDLAYIVYVPSIKEAMAIDSDWVLLDDGIPEIKL